MTTDSGMSFSDSSPPHSENYLPLAAQLAVANLARQNPKLIGQALSAVPPVLKLFCPKNSVTLLEEEQRVIFKHGAVVLHPT